MARRALPNLKQLRARSVSDPSHSLLECGSSRSVTYMSRPGDGDPPAVILIPGAVEQVMEATNAPVYFERYEIHGNMKSVPAEVLKSIRKNKVCLKGGIKTPVGGGVSSLNVQLRKELDLYALLVNCFILEHEVVPGVVGSLKNVLQNMSEYAYLNNRKKVTAVHKANIMKLADGLVLESCWEVASKYPSVEYNEIIVDNCCMQLVSNPEQFDVMVFYASFRLYLDQEFCEGKGNGKGNVGADHAVFEQVASAGNVGKEKMVEQKTANPIALLLSSAMMLKHLQFPSFADRLETAVKHAISEGRFWTKDLGGDSTTQEVVDAIIAKLD
ncbi:isocitrate dehydrogenase 1 [Actinidia rufa]|uniref:Isocitrate dehydrogenase 1 n=1 Tax=Actinidia rufa TaxID=165716 RepID=A0A7J0ETP2_9ERIC|nr:isocitrate dehydrogenase 1 [Actinidia rufa]